jgi:predicted TPR repeat methyltransferase
MPDGAPPIDPDVIAGRIATLLDDRRSGAVKPLLAALQKLAPDHPDIALLRAAYCCQVQDFALALRLLDDAIAKAPENPKLHLRRGEILLGRGQAAEAAQSAAEAILRAPDLPRAKSVLGLALLKLGQIDAALPCLAESFAADPSSVDVALALAALAPQDAAAILSTAIAATPHLGVLRNALARRHLCAGDIDKAGQIARQACADGLADAETWCLLAFAQITQSRWNDAMAAIAQALSLAPGHAWAARLKAALTGRAAGEIEPIAQPDALAAEQALFAGGTVLPGSYRAVLAQSLRSGPVLDLYCATGLNAIAAQDICGPWTGVEPDAGLLRRCAAHGLYNQLAQDDPRAFISHGAPYPIILLNEALAYTAAAESWFGALRPRLAAGGIALAAIPAGNAGLIGHGLYAHPPERIAAQAAAAGLAFTVQRTGILRHLEGIPLQGVIASFHPI